LPLFGTGVGLVKVVVLEELKVSAVDVELLVEELAGVVWRELVDEVEELLRELEILVSLLVELLDEMVELPEELGVVLEALE